MGKAEKLINLNTRLADQVVTLQTRLYLIEQLPEVKYQAVQSLNDMLGKVKGVKNEEAKKFWLESLDSLYVLLNFVDRLEDKINQLEKFNGELTKRNRKLTETLTKIKKEF